MDIMVVPKPIFNVAKAVQGYYLSFQIGNALLEVARTHVADASVGSIFFDFVNKIGLDALTMNQMIFIPVTDIHLATELENNCFVDPFKVVFLLNRKNNLSEQTLIRVKRFKEMGFRIAFFDFHNLNDLSPFLPYTDYIFCEHKLPVLTSVIKFLKANRASAKLIVKDVDTDEIFNSISSVGGNYFEGHFYKTPVINKNNPLSPLQVNYMQLLNQVNQEDFDLGKFSTVVQKDPALTIRFLQMVNSSYARSHKIKSLRHAAAMIGQTEIKRWIISAVASSMNQEKPDEVSRLSLIRARFCENIAGLFELGVHKENLYLMGLFSVLDVILDTTIEKALEMVFVPDKIKEALISEANEFGEVYRFVKLYEQGLWTEVSRIAVIRNILVRDIFGAYYEALTWYAQIVNMTFDDEGDEGDEFIE